MKETEIYFDVVGRFSTHTVARIPTLIDGSWEKPCYMFLDQASNTGFAIYDAKNRLVMGGIYSRGNLSLQDFKYQLKSKLEKLILIFGINKVFYEEVFADTNMWTTEVLYYIKHMIQDLGYENKSIEVFGLDNKSWKSKLAHPEKFDSTKDDKAEILRHVLKVYPLFGLDKEIMNNLGDMIDAIGMGIGMLIKSGATANSSFYENVRFNKKLPIHQMLIQKDDDVEWETLIKKLRKPYRTAFEQGGVVEMELNPRKGTSDLVRQYLTHKNSFVVVNIPYGYRDWGMLLLEHNQKPSEVQSEDKSFWLVSIRKKQP